MAGSVGYTAGAESAKLQLAFGKTNSTVEFGNSLPVHRRDTDTVVGTPGVSADDLNSASCKAPASIFSVVSICGPSITLLVPARASVRSSTKPLLTVIAGVVILYTFSTTVD